MDSFHDVMSGYVFIATLQLRTPLRVLEMDGLVVPVTATRTEPAELWHGIWVPKPKSWRSIGVDIPEFDLGTRASDIGPVPADGGEYLQFLKRFRRLFEGTPELIRPEALAALLIVQPAYQKFEAAHGGAEVMLKRAAGKSVRRRSAK